MPRHVRDIRKQWSGLSRGSHGHLQAGSLRGRSLAIEPGGVPFVILPHGDVEETGFVEQTNDQEAPEVPPSEDEVLEDEVLEDSNQGPTQKETD